MQILNYAIFCYEKLKNKKAQTPFPIGDFFIKVCYQVEWLDINLKFPGWPARTVEADYYLSAK